MNKFIPLFFLLFCSHQVFTQNTITLKDGISYTKISDIKNYPDYIHIEYKGVHETSILKRDVASLELKYAITDSVTKQQTYGTITTLQELDKIYPVINIGSKDYKSYASSTGSIVTTRDHLKIAGTFGSVSIAMTIVGIVLSTTGVAAGKPAATYVGAGFGAAGLVFLIPTFGQIHAAGTAKDL